MQNRLLRNITGYLALALVLTAIFLSIRYVSEFKSTNDKETKAVVTPAEPVIRKPADNDYEQRFRQLEMWLGQTQDTFEARFDKLEQQLAQTGSRSGQGTDPSGSPNEAKLKQLEQWLEQSQDAFEARFEKLEQQLSSATPQDNRLQEIEERLAQTTSRLNELSNSLGELSDGTTTVAVADKLLRLAPPADLPEQSPESAGDNPDGQSGQATEPYRLAPASRAGHGEGNWVINLASYLNEQTAARYMAAFRKKGVAAEMVPASVQGKTIYRVRLAGFDSREAARAIAPSVKRQLGLKDIWVMEN